jgi:hypothetical protein
MKHGYSPFGFKPTTDIIYELLGTIGNSSLECESIPIQLGIIDAATTASQSLMFRTDQDTLGYLLRSALPTPPSEPVTLVFLCCRLLNFIVLFPEELD